MRSRLYSFDTDARTSYTDHMQVHFTPELEAKVNEIAEETGRPADELVQDAMVGYLAELTQVRSTLDRRYDEIKSGRVKPIDGEEFFESLRRREDELLKRSASC